MSELVPSSQIMLRAQIFKKIIAVVLHCECECRYIVCELVMVSHGKPCIVNVSDGDITHCLRTQVQRLHGDYGLALVHLSLRGISSVIITVCSGQLLVL